jgi:hypothetical protein
MSHITPPPHSTVLPLGAHREVLSVKLLQGGRAQARVIISNPRCAVHLLVVWPVDIPLLAGMLKLCVREEGGRGVSPIRWAVRRKVAPMPPRTWFSILNCATSLLMVRLSASDSWC